MKLELGLPNTVGAVKTVLAWRASDVEEAAGAVGVDGAVGLLALDGAGETVTAELQREGERGRDPDAELGAVVEAREGQVAVVVAHARRGHGDEDRAAHEIAVG